MEKRGYSIIEGMVRQSCDIPIVATDSHGGVDIYRNKTSNGFSRYMVSQIRLCVEPPKTTTQGSTRILKNKKGTYFIGKPITSNARKTKLFLTHQLKDHAPSKPIEGAIDLYVEYNFSFNKTDSKAVKSQGKMPHIKRPDSDNLLKGLLDVMSDCKFWNDDSQISNLHFCKTKSADPCIKILIYEVKA